MKLTTEKKIMDMENRLVVANGDGEGEGWTGSMGLINLYIELLYDPTIPLLGIYLDKTFLEKDTRARTFIAALFTIAKTLETTQMSIDIQLD